MFKPLQQLNWLKLAKILLILIIVYLLFVLSICVFKYQTFSYNALDLAIYNQVFYNSSLGHLFQFTIHPTSYLGDHFEPLLLLLVPFYSLFKSPLTLIFFQTLLLALAAIPLFLIAKKYLSPWLTLLVIILYLFNPATLNINLFEFHLLALAPFFIFWTFYFYDQNKFWSFLASALACLLIREDVAFVIFMFGLVAILDKKKISWILTPLLGATAYFFLALKIIAYFSASSNYKFLVYYSWLGQNLQQIFINFFLKFPLVLQHILTLQNLEMILGFSLVFLFIPLYRPKYLLLSLGMFMQLLLGPATGELILRTHYGVIFLAALSICTIFALNALSKPTKTANFIKKYQDAFILILAVGLIYNFLVLGPLIPFVKAVFNTDYAQVKLKKEFVQQIPREASVVASYDLIPNLSSREKLYALNYLFLGRQQYDAGEYKIPAETQYLLFNFADFATFHLQYGQAQKKYYEQGAKNLSDLIINKNYSLIRAANTLALWQKDSKAASQKLFQLLKTPESITHAKNQIFKNQLAWLGYDQAGQQLSLYFKALTKIDRNYFLQIGQELYPLAYLYPTSYWPDQQIVKMNLFDLPKTSQIKIISIAGTLSIDGLGSTQNDYQRKEVIGEINLP